METPMSAQGVPHEIGKKADCTQCRIWRGAKTYSGYPVLWHNGRTRILTRVLWEKEHGPIPKGMCVCHACDNPSCYNIDHLFLGTYRDNVRDMCLKGRTTRVVGENHGKSKLTDDLVREIRKMYRSGKNITAIAKHCGLGRTCIRNAINRVTWKHVI